MHARTYRLRTKGTLQMEESFQDSLGILSFSSPHLETPLCSTLWSENRVRRSR
jgi:hypothetical protein